MRATVGRARRGHAAAALASVVALGLSVAGAGARSTAAAGSTGVQAVYTPYVDMTLRSDPMLPAIQRQTGAHALTLAFVIATAGRCQPSWGGTTPLSSAQIHHEVAAVRRAGAGVIVSFGGAGGTDLSQACASASSLSAAYRQAVTSYAANQVDFDLEGKALASTAGAQREILAIAQLEQWAHSQHRSLEVSLTLPVGPTGLPAQSLRTLRWARADHARIDLVNIMAMDFGNSTAPPGKNTMAGYAIEAAQATARQLQKAMPGATASRLGVTVMIGINDVRDELFKIADAKTLLRYGQSHHLGRLAIWSAARDRPCPKPTHSAQDNCSGVPQSPDQFSHTFDAFG